MHRFLGVGFLDNCMPLGMSYTVEFILDERFRKLHPSQPLRWHEKRKLKKIITSYGGRFFILSYFEDSK